MSKYRPTLGKKIEIFLIPRSGFGDIAQLVEQMTFNHWVQGSSPCVPTRKSAEICGFLFCPSCRKYQFVL